MFESIKLSDLPKGNCGILREGSSTRPTIWVIEENGARAIVKDFGTNRFLFRNIFGRFLVWRESRAYKNLGNIEGIPTLHRVIGGLALVLEEIPGKALGEFKKGEGPSRTFFDAMESLVDRVHKQGLAHCDLKRASNTLLSHDGIPYIIDWGASISKRECRLFPLNLIYRRFILDDHMAITKLKLRYAPETIPPEEIGRYRQRSQVEKTIRALRDRLRGILQKIA